MTDVFLLSLSDSYDEILAAAGDKGEQKHMPEGMKDFEGSNTSQDTTVHAPADSPKST